MVALESLIDSNIQRKLKMVFFPDSDFYDFQGHKNLNPREKIVSEKF